jgi:hypothetical protein
MVVHCSLELHSFDRLRYSDIQSRSDGTLLWSALVYPEGTIERIDRVFSYSRKIASVCDNIPLRLWAVYSQIQHACFLYAHNSTHITEDAHGFIRRHWLRYMFCFDFLLRHHILVWYQCVHQLVCAPMNRRSTLGLQMQGMTMKKHAQSFPRDRWRNSTGPSTSSPKCLVRFHLVHSAHAVPNPHSIPPTAATYSWPAPTLPS